MIDSSSMVWFIEIDGFATGERLSVAVKTVKHYVSMLFVKLGMEQRAQAAAYAARTFDGRTFGLSQDVRIINRKARDG